MAQYSRQVNLDASETGDVTRAVSPTCEVLGDDARTIFISPSLSYRVRYTSVWKGRSGLEKLLMVLVAVLLILCCSSFIIIFVSKQVNISYLSKTFLNSTSFTVSCSNKSSFFFRIESLTFVSCIPTLYFTISHSLECLKSIIQVISLKMMFV